MTRSKAREYLVGRDRFDLAGFVSSVSLFGFPRPQLIGLFLGKIIKAVEQLTRQLSARGARKLQRFRGDILGGAAHLGDSTRADTAEAPFHLSPRPPSATIRAL